jgi:hypothetical protein
LPPYVSWGAEHGRPTLGVVVTPRIPLDSHSPSQAHKHGPQRRVEPATHAALVPRNDRRPRAPRTPVHSTDRTVLARVATPATWATCARLRPLSNSPIPGPEPRTEPRPLPHPPRQPRRTTQPNHTTRPPAHRHHCRSSSRADPGVLAGSVRGWGVGREPRRDRRFRNARAHKTNQTRSASRAHHKKHGRDSAQTRRRSAPSINEKQPSLGPLASRRHRLDRPLTGKVRCRQCWKTSPKAIIGITIYRN